jgi:hypothetical protein
MSTDGNGHCTPGGSIPCLCCLSVSTSHAAVVSMANTLATLSIRAVSLSVCLTRCVLAPQGACLCGVVKTSELGRYRLPILKQAGRGVR